MIPCKSCGIAGRPFSWHDRCLDNPQDPTGSCRNGHQNSTTATTGRRMMTKMLEHASRSLLTITICLSVLASLPVLDVHAATLVVQTGTDPLANGDNFQAALNGANCGDTIILQAGATYGTRVAFTSS